MLEMVVRLDLQKETAFVLLKGGLAMEVSKTLLISMYCPKCGHKLVGKKRND